METRANHTCRWLYHVPGEHLQTVSRSNQEVCKAEDQSVQLSQDPDVPFF